MIQKISISQISGNLTYNRDLTREIRILILETLIEASSATEEDISLLLTSDSEADRQLGILYKRWKDKF